MATLQISVDYIRCETSLERCRRILIPVLVYLDIFRHSTSLVLKKIYVMEKMLAEAPPAGMFHKKQSTIDLWCFDLAKRVLAAYVIEGGVDEGQNRYGSHPLLFILQLSNINCSSFRIEAI